MRTLEERLAWLAGIIDGEGYVSATIATTKARRSSRLGRPRRWEPREVRQTSERSLRFQVSVRNSDPNMILEVASIVDLLRIQYFLFTYVSKKSSNSKRMYGIQFTGKERSKRVIALIHRWLITKKPQADLLLDMIRRREELLYHVGSLSDPVLVEQLKKLRILNRRGLARGESSEQVSEQFSVKRNLVSTSQRSFPHSVVGGRRRAQHPHLAEPAALSEEPLEGMG